MPNTRRRMTGTVVSNKMDKTVVVRTERRYRHPLYGKVIKSHNRFMAHDEANECEIGDQVIIVESRPLSKHKRWVVQEIVREDLSARTVEVAALAGVEQDIADVADDTIAADETADLEVAIDEDE